MLRKYFISILFLLFVFEFKFLSAEVKSYNGYTVLRLTPTIHSQLQYLHELAINDATNEYDFWTYPSQLNDTVDIMVPPNRISTFQNHIREKGITQSVMIEDVGKLMSTYRKSTKRQSTSFTKEVIPGFFEDYRTLDELNNFLTEIARQNPEIASIQTIGRSTQNREIRLLVLGSHDDDIKHYKRIFFIDATIHAREWIAGATVCYFIQYLVDAYNRNDPTVIELLEFYDFYIIPIANPDGYYYSHTTDRMWRKTRAPNSGSTCVGTDPNRNFDCNWGGPGSSTNPCSETYMGAAPADQPEVKAIQDYVRSRAVDIFAYFAFHSYSQLLLFPWGNTTNPTNDHNDLMRVGNAGAQALTARYGTQYTVGTTAQVLYTAAGNAIDWAYAIARIKYSYCPELRDTGTYGFLLPANQIVPSGEENVAMLVTIAQTIQKEIEGK